MNSAAYAVHSEVQSVLQIALYRAVHNAVHILHILHILTILHILHILHNLHIQAGGS